jgi:hypothetical protein
MRHVPTLGFLTLTLLAGCGDAPPAPTTPAAVTSDAGDTVKDPAALRALVETWIGAQNAGDGARYLEVMRGFLPTRAQLRAMLREGPATEAFLAAAGRMTVEGSPVAKVAPADKPLPKTTRTDVFVHAATTEEIAAYEKGSEAFEEFPGGMRRFAERIAAPGRVWYAVEMREPGHDAGTRITAFTRVGGHFLIVPKPWRVMPRAPESGAGK